MMTMSAASQVPFPAQPALLWVFRRNFESITSEVDVNAAGVCAVRTVPQWDPSLAIVERFDNPVDALHRHAEIAHRLREIGWMVAQHVPVQPAAA